MSKKPPSINQRVMWVVLICLLALCVSVILSPKAQAKDSINGLANDELAIDKLTEEQVVTDYLIKHQKLPDYYVTKKQARAQHWDARSGNLCKILPGKAIGGDRFFNRESKLPEQRYREWYEADLNYNCGRRGGDRVLYSNDGLIYVTHDHYATFKQVQTE